MDNKSLTHTRWNCTYHIVFIPKYRRKVLYGKIRQELIDIFKQLCAMKKVTLISGAICPDHVHMYLAIPPKLSVSEIVAYLKGKSALMIFDNHPEFRGRWGERHMWARGYYVDTVGNVNEETIKNYIKMTGEGRLSAIRFPRESVRLSDFRVEWRKLLHEM